MLDIFLFKRGFFCLRMHTKVGLSGLSLDIRTVSADFQMCSKKLKIKVTLVQKLKVQNQTFIKSVGAKAVILKIFGCSAPTATAPTLTRTLPVMVAH